MVRLVGVKPGTFTFWMSPKDNSGNYSDTPKSTTCTVIYPAGVDDDWSWDYSTGIHANTVNTNRLGTAALKCQHSGEILSGEWLSSEYDLGSVKEVTIWGDFLTDFSAGRNTCNDIWPSGELWSSKDLTKNWNTLLAGENAAAQVHGTLYWGDSSGSLDKEVSFFEILAADISGRYVQVKVQIVDPLSEANLYIYELNMTARDI